MIPVFNSYLLSPFQLYYQLLFLACPLLILELARCLVSKCDYDFAIKPLSHPKKSPTDSKALLVQLKYLQKVVYTEKLVYKASWSELFKTKHVIRSRVVLAILIMYFLQSSGIDYFISYG